MHLGRRHELRGRAHKGLRSRRRRHGRSGSGVPLVRPAAAALVPPRFPPPFSRRGSAAFPAPTPSAPTASRRFPSLPAAAPVPATPFVVASRSVSASAAAPGSTAASVPIPSSPSSPSTLSAAAALAPSASASSLSAPTSTTMLTPALALGTAGALLPDVGSLPGTLTSFRAPRGTLTLGCGSVATFVGSCRAAGLSWSLLLVCTLLQKGEKEKEDSLHCPCQQVCLYSHDLGNCNCN